MAIACGIVGLPNVGKSTLFNALTAAGIAAENYPFCTIEPNQGIVEVPDPRLGALTSIVSPQKTLPATVEFVDIAGLVEGAASGEGLGNKFLAHIRETNAIAHVVRCFENEDITHVSGSIDPLRDIATIDTELMLADLASMEKQYQKVSRSAKSGNKDDIALGVVLEKIIAQLNEGKPVRSLTLNDTESRLAQTLHCITAKPVLYVANVTDPDDVDNAYVQKVREHAAEEGAEVVAICAQLEAEIASLDDDAQQEFLQEMGLEEPGLNRVIRAAFSLLGLQTYFTAGEKEVRAWTVLVGATAPQAAAAIHTDFEKGFIRAEVIAFDDYVKGKGEQGAKEAGKLRLEGKEYIVNDGDVVHFRFNV